MSEFIEIPPSPSKAVKSFRNFGYNFEQAVADLVDNSIAANSTKINITFMRTFNDDLEFKILDNGHGIDGKERLKDALKYGSEDKNTDFNQFGLGLKTATTSQCKRLTVLSKSNQSNLKGILDVDIIREKDKWLYEIDTIFTSDEEYLFKDIESGTLVIWEKFDKLKIGKNKQSLDKRLEKLKHHLSITFQRFLDHTIETKINLDIFVNDEKLIPFDPFLTTNQNTDVIIDKSLQVSETINKKVSFKGYSLPRFSTFSSKDELDYSRVKKTEYQGYYMYRQDRLVVFGTWLERHTVDPHFNLCRIGLFFNKDLDDILEADVRKSKFSFKDEELFQNIVEHTLPVRKAADNKYREGNKKIIKEKTKNAHESSSKIITSKEKELNDFSDATFNEETQKVTFTNNFGQFDAKYKFSSPKNNNEVNIETVESLDDGLLFEPKFVKLEEENANNAVPVCAQLNTNHEYYRKVIYPNHHNENFINYFDALIWAFCNAELKTYSEQAKENYKELRYDISKSLRKLVEDFPEPKIEEEFETNEIINNEQN